MSVKHVNTYYNKIVEQYKEMIDNIKDLEEEAKKGLVEPERIERLRDQVAPLKDNYERWSYMMYLLHQPNKKEKVKKYERQNKKLLNNLSKKNSLDSVLQENTETLLHIGE